MALTQLGGIPGLEETMDGMKGGQRAGFIDHVFRFDTETRSELLNITQYGLLATPLIFMMNKVVQRAFPEVDDSKYSLEITAEVAGQLVSLIVALFFIHRLITFVPTYSEVGYTHLNYLAVIVAVLTVILSIQSKLGEKVMILADRLSMATVGVPISEDRASKRKSSRAEAPKVAVPTHQPSQSDYVSAAPGMSMPNTGGGVPEYTHPSMVPQVQSPMMMAQATQPSNTGAGYDSMYQASMFEPMAANGAIGGGFGSPW
jgi:hypothetical protein